MKLPEKCPHCGITFGAAPHGYLIIRNDLNFGSEYNRQIENQIFECNNCHTLFRARYELIVFISENMSEPKYIKFVDAGYSSSVWKEH